MKIGYIFEEDADSPDVRSGRPHSILSALENSGHTVQRCFPLIPRLRIRERLAHALATRLGRRYLRNRSPQHLKGLARAAQTRLQSEPHDLVFCPSTLPIAYLNSSRPVVFSSDSTFRQMLDYYPAFSDVGPAVIRHYDRAERTALQRASLLVYSSDWAAQSAIEHYGIPEQRVAVIPSGANLGAENRMEDIARWILSRQDRRLELLFVGKAWERKGGPICVETVRILNARGIPTILHVAGCQPPIASQDTGIVVSHGHLRTSRAAERRCLSGLFRRSHFLLMPSQAEAFGMALCEANAFGIPCIATATGGIPSIIEPGINGVLLSRSVDALACADAIGDLWKNRSRYLELARGAQREFCDRLNWRIWAENFLSRIEPLFPPTSPVATAIKRSLSEAKVGPASVS